MGNSNTTPKTYARLNNGTKIPLIGLGTWAANDNEVYEAVKESIRQGYRHIDTAYVYENEAEVGKALKESINEGLVTREEMFITTKLWCDCHHPEDVEWSVQQSLKELGVEYIDLYLIHWPCAFIRADRENRDPNTFKMDDTLHFVETWKAMEKLVEKGFVKSIGVSNFTVEQLQEIMEISTITPAVNQIEAHCYRFPQDLIDFCKANRIVIEAYAPIGSPGNMFNIDSDLLSNPTVMKVAESHDVSTAQILISFLTQQGIVALPKSVKPKRIASNADVFRFTLTKCEIDTLKGLHNGTQFYYHSQMKTSKFFPFKDSPDPLENRPESVQEEVKPTTTTEEVKPTTTTEEVKPKKATDEVLTTPISVGTTSDVKEVTSEETVSTPAETVQTTTVA